MMPRVVLHPLNRAPDGNDAEAFRGMVLPKAGELKASARAHLSKISSWWPKREGRRYFWLYPAGEEDKAAYKALLKDLVDRDRALAVEAGDGRHMFHIIPPTKQMLQKKVVASQHKTHLVVVYGREGKR